MAYIGQKPADKPLGASDITDGIISTDKLADTSVTNAKLNANIISAETELSSAPASTDEFLISDAGTLKRIDASLVGGKDFELLATTDITSSTAEVEFDGLFSSTYKNYKIIISGLLPVTSGVRFQAQLKESGSYITSGAYSFIIGADIVYNTTSTGAANNEGQTNYDRMRLTSEMTNTTSEHNALDITMYDPLGNHYKGLTWHNQNYGAALTNLHRSYVGSGIMRNSTNDCTAIRFYMDSGNIAKGNFKLYGMK